MPADAMAPPGGCREDARPAGRTGAGGDARSGGPAPSQADAMILPACREARPTRVRKAAAIADRHRSAAFSCPAPREEVRGAFISRFHPTETLLRQAGMAGSRRRRSPPQPTSPEAEVGPRPVRRRAAAVLVKLLAHALRDRPSVAGKAMPRSARPACGPDFGPPGRGAGADSGIPAADPMRRRNHRPFFVTLRRGTSKQVRLPSYGMPFYGDFRPPTLACRCLIGGSLDLRSSRGRIPLRRFWTRQTRFRQDAVLKVVFKTKQLENCYRYHRKAVRRYGRDVGKRYIQRIATIKRANDIQELMEQTGLRCHILKGDRKGQYAVDINVRYRLIFSLEDELLKIIRIEEVSNHYGD